MVKDMNQYIKRALKLARELTILADEGESDCNDDGCAVLCGVIRDCAYKIRGRAEREQEFHNRMRRRTENVSKEKLEGEGI